MRNAASTLSTPLLLFQGYPCRSCPYTSKLLAKTHMQRGCETSFSKRYTAQHRRSKLVRERWNWSRNVVARVAGSDWLTWRTVTRPSETILLHGETLVFITTSIVAEVREGCSTFPETCLATEIQQSFMKPTMLHGAMPAETCFAVLLHRIFS